MSTVADYDKYLALFDEYAIGESPEERKAKCVNNTREIPNDVNCHSGYR